MLELLYSSVYNRKVGQLEHFQLSSVYSKMLRGLQTDVFYQAWIVVFNLHQSWLTRGRDNMILRERRRHRGGASSVPLRLVRTCAGEVQIGSVTSSPTTRWCYRSCYSLIWWEGWCTYKMATSFNEVRTETAMLILATRRATTDKKKAIPSWWRALASGSWAERGEANAWIITQVKMVSSKNIGAPHLETIRTCRGWLRISNLHRWPGFWNLVYNTGAHIGVPSNAGWDTMSKVTVQRTTEIFTRYLLHCETE